MRFLLMMLTHYTPLPTLGQGQRLSQLVALRQQAMLAEQQQSLARMMAVRHGNTSIVGPSRDVANLVLRVAAIGAGAWLLREGIRLWLEHLARR